MNKISQKLWVIAIAGMVSFTACDNEGKGGENKPSIKDLSGVLESNLTLTANTSYDLDGVLRVPDGITLTIEEGVTITALSDDDIVDYILVEQGGKIVAEGTSSAPIVMTAEDKTTGAWGGLHICGKAPINKTTGTSEIGGAAYGGNQINDNSGMLKYIRLEYTGYAFDEESESNGLTLYGVGNGTIIEYVQSYMGADDGFEWFGGSVNCDYLISTGSGDDSFDWTQGWVGEGNYWVAQQISGSDHGDALVEADNNGSDNLATPISNPTLNYLTLIGSNTEGNKGIRLREGTYASISNAIVIGKEKSMVIETPQTAAYIAEGNKLNNIVCSGAFSTEETAYTQEMFTDAGNKLSYDVSSINGFVGKIGNAGAVASDNDWTKGWSKTL